MFKALPLYLIEEQLSEKNLFLPTETNLSRFVFIKEMIFDIEEIAHLPFYRQIEVYDALEAKYPDLHKAVYSHNSALRALRDDIVMYKNKGITPRVALKQLANGLILGGTRMVGKEYAGDSAIYAAAKFSVYLENLDKKFRELVLKLGTWSGKTIHLVLNDLNKRECVETAASNIHDILDNQVNKSVIDTIPALKASQLKMIEQKYQNKAGFLRGEEDNFHLPKARQIDAIKSIKIHNAEDLVILLLDFDPDHFDAVFESINLDKNKEVILKELQHAINQGIFASLQKKMLENALIKHIGRFLTNPLQYLILFDNEDIVS